MHLCYIVMFSRHTLFWLDVKLYSWYSNSQPCQIMKFLMELGLFEDIYMMTGTKDLHEVSEILCSWPSSVSQNIEDLSQAIIIFENGAYKKNITVTHKVREDLSPSTHVLIWLRSNSRALLLYTGIKIRKVVIYSMRRTTTRHRYRPP